MIRQAAPELFAKLPAPWTQEKLAKTIEETRESIDSTPGLRRHGKLLIFNYGVDESGPYIEALRPFFELYASQPFDFMTADMRRRIVLDVQKKLLHEVHHHWFPAKDETEDAVADQAAMRILRALHRNVISCKTVAEVRTGYGLKQIVFVYFRALGQASIINDVSITFQGTANGLIDRAKNEERFDPFGDSSAVTWLQPVRILPSNAGIIQFEVGGSTELRASRATLTFAPREIRAVGEALHFRDDDKDTAIDPPVMRSLEYRCEQFVPDLSFR